MNANLPFLTDLLLATRELDDSVTLTMSKAWDLELVLLAAVGSWVLSLLPLCNSLMTSSADFVSTSDNPATCKGWQIKIKFSGICLINDLTAFE